MHHLLVKVWLIIYFSLVWCKIVFSCLNQHTLARLSRRTTRCASRTHLWILVWTCFQALLLCSKHTINKFVNLIYWHSAHGAGSFEILTLSNRYSNRGGLRAERNHNRSMSVTITLLNSRILSRIITRGYGNCPDGICKPVASESASRKYHKRTSKILPPRIREWLSFEKSNRRNAMRWLCPWWNVLKSCSSGFECKYQCWVWSWWSR